MPDPLEKLNRRIARAIGRYGDDVDDNAHIEQLLQLHAHYLRKNKSSPATKADDRLEEIDVAKFYEDDDEDDGDDDG